MSPNVDDLTPQLQALLIKASTRMPIPQGEVRAFVEGVVAARSTVKRSRRRLRTHEQIKAEVERQKREER